MTYATDVAMPDPLIQCAGPGVEPVPPQQPGPRSQILNPLCHSRNSPTRTFKVSCTPNPYETDHCGEITERHILVQSVAKLWSLGSKYLHNQQEKMMKARTREVTLSEPNFLHPSFKQ